ncbi:MAG: alpha/beta hydrolase [Chloroflexi bacterium]|nr:alpha/beta hydrolase [Chloroflexota bacterium]
MPLVTVDNRSVSLDVRGSGSSTVLFIHGVGPGGAAWDLVTQGLAETCRAFVLDLPGFGKSERGSSTGSIDDAATLVHRVLHAQGNTEAVPIVGHAFGGLVALNFAARFPSHVSHLALVSTAGFDGDPRASLERLNGIENGGWDADGADAWLRAGLVEELAEGHFAAMRDATAGVDADLIAECVASSARRVLLEDASEITAPTLLVRGSDDPLVSDGDVQILAARLAAAEVFTLPDVGHWPSLEAPDELRVELVRFLGI